MCCGVDSLLPMRDFAPESPTVDCVDLKCGLCRKTVCSCCGSGSRQARYSGAASREVSGKNRRKFCVEAYEDIPWTDRGLTAKYPLVQMLFSFKRLVDELKEIDIWRSGKRELDRVYSLLGLARVSCIMAVQRPDIGIFLRVCWNELSVDLQRILQPNVYELCRKTKCSRDTARKFAVLMAFDVSWDECLRLVRSICPEGGLSHTFSYEEALVLVHMKTNVPSGFLLDWGKRGSEQLEYARCLLGALVKAMKTDHEIPEDFHFCISTDFTPVGLFLQNAIDFLVVYSDHTTWWEGCRHIPIRR